jgi:hypothetical protein
MGLIFLRALLKLNVDFDNGDESGYARLLLRKVS